MPDQKIQKAPGLKNFFIATFAIFIIFFGFVLVKRYLEHARTLELSSIFILMIASIFYVYVQSKTLLNSKSENTFNDGDRDQYQVSPKVQKLIGVIAAFILGTLFLILLGGNTNVFKTQILVPLEPEPFNDYLNITVGILLILESTKNLFKLKKSFLNSILSLFEFMLIVPAVILYLQHM
ncbi:MAG: hypothetical protein RLZZ04_4730 [Cyanobacteriota bacterium]|jgi:hypothetical protein